MMNIINKKAFIKKFIVLIEYSKFHQANATNFRKWDFFFLHKIIYQFKNDPPLPSISLFFSFIFIFIYDYVAYHVYAWFETYYGSVDRTSTTNFDAQCSPGTEMKKILSILRNIFEVKLLPFPCHASPSVCHDWIMNENIPLPERPHCVC